jgi:hypothetical protein
MPGDAGHLEAMRLLPFTAAICGRDRSLVGVVILSGNRGAFRRVTCRNKYIGVRGSPRVFVDIVTQPSKIVKQIAQSSNQSHQLPHASLQWIWTHMHCCCPARLAG